MAVVNVESAVASGDLWKCMVVVDGGPAEKYMVRDDADLDRQVLARLAVKARVITLGPRTVTAPVVKQPDPPTQADLDRAAFAVLVREYEQVVAAVKAGVGKVTQADVDAAYAAMKSAYRDEYAPLLVGVF